MNEKIENYQKALSEHPLYFELNSLGQIRKFMKYHVFAVWDFMSLLKSLQRHITCVSLPWEESPYETELVQLVNEIVLGEESDKDQEGRAVSHYSLYRRSMEEVGADTQMIDKFLETKDFSFLPAKLSDIVGFHVDLAQKGEVHEVASSFFYGREKLIPEMFSTIVNVLERENLHCPSFLYYLKRHIEVDGQEHGPKAMRCLEGLCKTPEKKQRALEVATLSLQKRQMLWDFILEEEESR